MLGCLAAALMAACALAVYGCAGGASEGTIAGAIVAVSERDFQIQAPTLVKSGAVDLRVRNEGPDQHELIVVRSDRALLPTRKDGLTIDEEALESFEAGALEPGEPGGVRNLELHLKPGRYVLFCNMEGHFMGGMHTELVVS